MLYFPYPLYVSIEPNPSTLLSPLLLLLLLLHDRPKELPHDCVVEVVSEIIPEMVIEDNHTRLIHAANTASLAGFNGNYLKDIVTENGGNVKGNREINLNGFTDDKIIAQLNDEVENINMNGNDYNHNDGDNDSNDDNDDDNYDDSDDDGRREYSRNNYKEENEGEDEEEVVEEEEEEEEEGKEESFPKELLKCKLRVSSPSASLLSSSRRFDLTSAYRSLLSDQDSMRRSQGTFLKNQEPKKGIFRRSKSCPRSGEEGRGVRMKESEHVKGRDRGSERGSEREGGREGVRYDYMGNLEGGRRSDEGNNGREYRRHKDDERRSGKAEGRASSNERGRDRGSDRGKGRGIIRDYKAIEHENRNDIFNTGHQDEDDNENNHVEIAAEPIMKRGRGRGRESERERGKGKGFEKKAHVQYVRPASASASKDFKLRNTTSFSTSNRPPVQNIAPYTGNYYPLRSSTLTSTSTSNHLLSARQNNSNLKTLNGRNAFSLPYPCIIPDTQPYYQNALTNAVEKVVTNFFR